MHRLFKGAPHGSVDFFEVPQIQEIIEYIRADSDRLVVFLESLTCDNRDWGAIRHVLTEGYEEEFRRYDSAVEDEFLTTYTQLCR